MAVTKFLLLAVAAIALCIVNGKPVEQTEEVDFQALAKKFQEDAQRQFDEFRKQSQSQFNFPDNLQPPPNFDVKNLPKDGNTHVFGQSETKYHVESVVNGKKTEESGGHRVINDDGKITEYDLP